MDEGLYTVQIVSKQLHSSKQENNNINVVELIKYATEEDAIIQLNLDQCSFNSDQSQC